MRKVTNILDDLLKNTPKELKAEPKPRLLLSIDIFKRMCIEEQKTVSTYRGYKIHTDERIQNERIYLIKA